MSCCRLTAMTRGRMSSYDALVKGGGRCLVAQRQCLVGGRAARHNVEMAPCRRRSFGLDLDPILPVLVANPVHAKRADHVAVAGVPILDRPHDKPRRIHNRRAVWVSSNSV